MLWGMTCVVGTTLFGVMTCRLVKYTEAEASSIGDDRCEQL